MSTNVRINVLDSAALDGVTPVPPGTVVTQNPDGIYEVTLPIGAFFGLFDPGTIPQADSGRGGNYILQHVEIIQDPAVPLGAGDLIQIVGPGLGGALAPATGYRRTIIDFGDYAPGDGLTSGLFFEGLCTPFPIDHQIAFTTALGNGPYAILINYTPAPGLPQSCQPPSSGGGPSVEELADLSGLNAGEAIEAVESSDSTEALERWAEEEGRVTVSRAIEARIDELGED